MSQPSQRLRLDQHLKRMKPQLLGLCLWSKVAIILGRLTPVSSLNTGSSPCVKWKSEILPFPREAVTQSTFTQQNDFLPHLLGLEAALAASWKRQFSGEKALICTLAAFTLGALSLRDFSWKQVHCDFNVYGFIFFLC